MGMSEELGPAGHRDGGWSVGMDGAEQRTGEQRRRDGVQSKECRGKRGSQLGYQCLVSVS